ncbi:hypothetical protein VSDG_03420 [Cytospora chrysosperma]|uniref:NADH dehydrogenase [ubiquinone] 1 beta subcomplex subunit 9 n=1 Tax=Cytospora chrysosperma TaxID=252740 RepID=A0A423W9T4_CYTCH|nr:hypothetical protein VSDG_03420 [Valsa sordida]
MSSSQAALSLYRRSLKLALDWAVHRNLWRGQAIYIRSLFEANRNITNPRQQRALLKETEKLLETWKHPDPYLPPMAPGGTLSADNINATSVYYQSDILMRHNTGSKFERNLPTPRVDPPPPLKF